MNAPNKVLSYCLFTLLIFLLGSCANTLGPDYYRQADFNAGWSYHIGEVENPTNPGSNDPGWKPVHLPHDWSIEDYKIQDSLHQGPFFKDLAGGSDVGYLRDGIAWYRKDFRSPDDLGGKRLVLDFEGVQTQMELWINGVKTGEHVYGYTPIKFDITSALKGEGEINTIAVKTINTGENSRWFAGAGIYRPVHISMLNTLAIAPWGVQITTSDESPNSAVINFAITVDNLQQESTEAECWVELISPDGVHTTLDPLSMTLAGESQSLIDLTTVLKNPSLWGLEHPDLYRAIVSIQSNGRKTDSYQSSFGIRSIAYSAEEGFLLNGEEILMKGGCMHHDNGLLGAAAFPDAEYRRVKIMKENGFNAIRTSHNPPSVSFLDACDEMGMLVIDEAFDHWVKPKRPNDYSNYFEKWSKSDIQAMVYRDRNHPSVVMWSFGNEIPERADPEGVEIGKKLIAAIREVDNTRPLTQAICDFWDNPGREWDYSEGAFEIQDIGGYNYKYENYETDHLKYPDRLIYGSETFPLHAWENWELVKKHPYVIGDFVWTGMDYLGESGIGHIRYTSESDSQAGFHQAWPWYNAWCGDIDIIGNKKPQSYYRDVVWGESRLEIMVENPVPSGKIARMSYWGWYDELNSWNREGDEGKVVKVKVYSSYTEVSLELNGVEIGTKEIEAADRYTAEFEVKYSPGVLTATGTDGEKTDIISLTTAKEASKLLLISEKETLTAQRNSIVYIRVEARDEDGVLAINEDSELVLEISGAAELLAAGNANPLHQGSFTDGVFKLFRGKGLIILRSAGSPGEVSVKARSNNMPMAELSLEAH